MSRLRPALLLAANLPDRGACSRCRPEYLARSVVFRDRGWDVEVRTLSRRCGFCVGFREVTGQPLPATQEHPMRQKSPSSWWECLTRRCTHRYCASGLDALEAVALGLLDNFDGALCLGAHPIGLLASRRHGFFSGLILRRGGAAKRLCASRCPRIFRTWW